MIVSLPWFSQGCNDLITLTIENKDLAGLRWLLEYCSLPIEGHFCSGCGNEHVCILAEMLS